MRFLRPTTAYIIEEIMINITIAMSKFHSKNIKMRERGINRSWRSVHCPKDIKKKLC